MARFRTWDSSRVTDGSVAQFVMLYPHKRDPGPHHQHTKGLPMFPPDFEAPDIVSAYTREQAIEDGVLIDMNREPFATLSREAGLKSPI